MVLLPGVTWTSSISMKLVPGALSRLIGGGGAAFVARPLLSPDAIASGSERWGQPRDTPLAAASLR
jgi:hypothetical protein